MLVLAPIPIVGAAPVPAILFLFNSLKEKLANDVGPAPFDDLSLLLADHLVQILLR